MPASTLDYLLVLTSAGRVYLARGHDVPIGTRASAGEPVQKVFGLRPDEAVAAILPVAELSDGRYVVWFSANGKVKKTALPEYRSINSAGLNDFKLLAGDSVAAAALSDGSGDYLVIASDGQALRFSDAEVRSTGRDGQGVNAMTLKEGATVVAGLALPAGDAAGDLFIVTEGGLGKRTGLAHFPVKHRATSGIAAISLAKDDRVAGAILAGSGDGALIASADGRLDRLAFRTLRRQGRTTKGSPLIVLASKDRVSSVGRLGSS